MSRPPANGQRFGSKNGNISFLTVSICNPRKKVKRYFVMSVEITDNSKEVSAAIKAALLRGLEKCGLVAEGYAKKLCPVDTGNLRNSITHVVDEQEPAAIIGTDNEYGTKLLTYATPAIEAALSDYAARYSSSLSIPISRYNQLRRVAYLCAEGWDSPDAELAKVVCGELNVSAKVAGALIKEYRTLFCVRQLGDDVFSVSCGGDPAVAYDRLMRRTLLMQRMDQVLTPRELNLVRSYLGIGQPDEVGLTFQELAIRLNYNGPSGAEKAYKAALRKLKKDLYGGAYGRWLSAQKAIRAAKAEAEQAAGHHATPQITGLDEKELMERFICEVVSLIRVHEVFSDALENIAAKIFEES